MEKCLVEKCWMRVLYRNALSSSKVDDGFILDVQDSKIASGQDRRVTGPLNPWYFFEYIWYARKANKNMFLLSWIAGTASMFLFRKFSLRLPYIISIAIYVSNKKIQEFGFVVSIRYFCC